MIPRQSLPVVSNCQNLKEMFKAYLENLNSPFDKLINNIEDAIKSGNSQTDILENMTEVKPICNSFPVSTPTDKLFSELLVVVEAPLELAEGFKYIYDWLGVTKRMFNERKVCVLTDKLDTVAVKKYECAFKRYQKVFKNEKNNIICRFGRKVPNYANVVFAFRLFTNCGSVKILFLR